MTINTVSNIKWAGHTYKSNAVLDCNGKINIPITLYLVNLSINGKSYNTTLNYAYRLESYFNVLKSSGDMDWRSVDDEAMTVYINKYLYQNKNLTKKSIQGHIATLDGFYKWAWRYGYLTRPIVYSFILSHKEKKSSVKTDTHKISSKYMGQYIEPAKLETLLENLKTNDPYLLERDELILTIGYTMGLRRSEIVNESNLKVNELINLKNHSTSERMIRIIGKRSKVRDVPIPPKTFEMIERFLNGRHKKTKSENLICSKQGKILGNSLPYVIYKQASIRTKDPYWDSIVFHSFRHSFATNMVSTCYEEQIDPWAILPQYMGHKDKSTTFGYVFFEAVLMNRHSLLKKLMVEERHINKTNQQYKKRND